MLKRSSIALITLFFLCRTAAAFTNGTASDFAGTLFMSDSFSLAGPIFRAAAATSPDERVAGGAFYMEAESHYKAGRYREALKGFVLVTEKYPAARTKYRKELYYRIAGCYYELKDYERSGRYTELLLNEFPDSYLTKDALLLSAENRLLTGKHDGALDSLNRLEKFTDYAHFDYVYFLKGRIYLDKAGAGEKDLKKNAEEALRYFERIKREFPESRILNHADFRKAEALYALGRYREARNILENVLKKEEDEKFRILVMYFLAWNRYMLKDYRGALGVYDEVITRARGDIISIWAEYKKGMCFEAAGDGEKALEQFAFVSSRHPMTIPAAYADYAAANHYYVKGEIEEAVMRFQNVISSYNVEELARASYYMLAEIYMVQNQYVMAREIYAKIERTIAEDALKARYMTGWCYFKEGNYNEALKIFSSIAGDEGAERELRLKSVLKTGDAYYEIDDPASALKYYDEALSFSKEFPDVGAEASYGKGWIRYRANDFTQALALFRQARNTAASHDIKLRADFMAANALFSGSKFEQALSVYTGIINNSRSPKNLVLESVFYAGWCRYRTGKFDEAIAYWKRYTNEVKESVKKAEGTYRIGWAYFRKNDFNEAVSYFGEILEKYPGTHLYQEALLKTGDSYYNNGDYEKAVEYYKELVEKYPSHYRIAEALYGIQWSYYRLGESEKAVEISKAFVDKYPESSFTPEIQYRVAEHYYNNGRFETAAQEFGKFLVKYPGHALSDNALYWSGISLFNIKKYSESIITFRELNTKYPSNQFYERALFKSGNAYYRLRDFKGAVDAYIDFIERFPGSALAADAKFNIAMSHRRLGNIPETKEWYLKFLEEHPKSELFERALLNMGYLLQDEKNHDEAIKYFERAVKAGGKRAVEAQYWIGDSYQFKKEYDRAIKEYMKVYSNFKQEELWVVSSLDAAGKIYESQGKLQQAIDTYRKIADTAKGKRYKDTALKRIELLREQMRILTPEKPPEKGAQQ
ncbi:MAG TPA: tetratricopeptide repeat protein [bacterium]|nr:tetratricopeptide repeat protein [bacterium]